MSKIIQIAIARDEYGEKIIGLMDNGELYYLHGGVGDNSDTWVYICRSPIKSQAQLDQEASL